MPMPVQNAEAQGLIKMLAGAGGGGAPGGSPPGMPGAPAPPGGSPAPPGGSPAPSPQAQQLGAATSQLDGANPQGMITTLREMNDALAQVYLTAAMRIPDMAEDISKARASLERAIKKATLAGQVVQSAKPIMNSAGVGPQAGATPGAGGPPDISAMLGAGAGA